LSGFPIRARLTAAFALAMVAMLTGFGAFAYLHLRADLNDAVNDGLEAHAEAVVEHARESSAPLPEFGGGPSPDPEEGFTQILAPSGRILDATSDVSRPVLTSSQLARASTGPVVVERNVPPIEGVVRVFARPVSSRRGSPVVAVGLSLDDRDEVLSRLVAAFAGGAPAAVVLASVLGYFLAAAGLAPIEAMRRRAGEVSLDRGERLPLPAAYDEVRRLGETLNEMLDRLQRSFERERRFVADASHELRTPVAVLKTEIEAALRTEDAGPQAREALTAALDECDNLAQLAEDLLVIARSADGRLPVRHEELRARSVLDSVQERFADRARQHGRPIRVEAADDLAIQADPLRVRQALGNLVDNALRHGDGEIVLSARRADGGVEIDVADQGPGFAPEIAERAFERFTRGDAARTRGGAGLGMAIVRAIAEAHSGRTEVTPADGTTVRLWLPDSPPPAARRPAA
jgi:signal transduction histidine kinase